MKRPTIASLQSEIATLQPYRELVHSLQRGNGETRTLSCGDHSITVTALGRQSGGIVTHVDGQAIGAMFLDEWCARVTVDRDPLRWALVVFARKVQREAAEARYA